MIADGAGRAIAFRLAPGQAHELPNAIPLLNHLPGVPKWVVADRGYTSHAFRKQIWNISGRPAIPPLRHEAPVACPDWIYNNRNRVECLWARLKEWRAVATRYEKTAVSFLGVLQLAAALDWVRLWNVVTSTISSKVHTRHTNVVHAPQADQGTAGVAAQHKLSFRTHERCECGHCRLGGTMRPTDGIDGLLAELGRQVGLDLAFDASRRCVLACDGDIDIEIFNPSGGNGVLITAPLAAVGSDEHALLRVCMAMNLGLTSTRGCTLALDERRSAVVLQWLGQADELDHTGFVNRIGGLIGLVDPLRKQITAALIDSAPAIVSGHTTVDDDTLAHLLHIRA